MAKYAYLGAYLGARYMVKWGVPEKILQNAVQMRWSYLGQQDPPVKSYDKINFLVDYPIVITM